MVTTLPPKPNGTQEAWLDAAYEVLTESGVEAVKIMKLAKRLGLTRTGFYWHFKDREALLEAVIDRWENRNTGNLIARTQAEASTITGAMFNLFDCWVDDRLFDAPLDLAIRNWARNDSALQARVRRADDNRMTAIAAMFARFGYDAAQAQVRAMTVIYTQIGYISMQVNEDRQTRLDRMPAYIEVFTGKPPGVAEVERFMARHGGGHAKPDRSIP